MTALAYALLKSGAYHTDRSFFRQLEFFEGVWESLAARGKADEVGGCEFLRVVEEWIASGFPRPIPRFVAVRSSRTPDLFE